MTFHFTQEISVSKTGFGNDCKITLGPPTPIASEFVEGSTLVEFDQHPYLAESGYGNPNGSEFPEEPVASCTAALITHYQGMTRCPLSVDFSTPSFWGINGLSNHPGIEKSDDVRLNKTMTEVSFEVDYDSTAYVAFDLSRAAFQYVVVEKDGERWRFENVPCLPKLPWRNAVTTFRMWGETESWGSEDETFLTIPYRDVRRVIRA